MINLTFYFSVVLMALFFGACSNEAPLSRYKGQEVLVAKIVAAANTEQQIAECKAWMDRAHNDERIEIPKSKFRHSVFSQWVWLEAAQVGTGVPGRVTPNHFDMYNSFIGGVVKAASPKTILEKSLKCVDDVESASGGIDRVLRASR